MLNYRFDLALISPRLLLLVLLMVMTCCHPTTSAASPGLMNNALLWKRLGLNRAIGDEGGQPQITSSKKKGESTVYLIKLPPQPHYYIPLNYLSAAGDKDSDEPSGAKKAISTPDPFETVSLDFTANGKPESVYHWNLPLGYTMPTSSSTTTSTTTSSPLAPSDKGSHYSYYKKPHIRQRYYNNGKPQKLYFVKPSYYTTPLPTPSPSTEAATSTTMPSTTTPAGTAAANKQQFKKHFAGNGKPNQFYFVKQSSYRKSHL